MEFLYNKSTRSIVMVAIICLFGFLIAYLSGGLWIVEDMPSPQPPAAENTPVTPAPDAEAETPAVDNTTAANYYVRLNRGLSSSEEKLVLEQPIQMKTAVEYRGELQEKVLSSPLEIEAILSLLNDAQRLPDDTEVVSISSSHDVSLTLPYTDGYGNLYIFEGYPDGAKKSVTLIQDNSNKLYKSEISVINKLYDMIKPVETSLHAERISVYSCHNFEKGRLQAQCKDKAQFELFLSMLNSLERRGSSLDLDDPDYVISLLPENSVTEDNYCYLWLDEKQLKVAFAEDSFTVYEATEVSSAHVKKWVKEFAVK